MGCCWVIVGIGVGGVVMIVVVIVIGVLCGKFECYVCIVSGLIVLVVVVVLCCFVVICLLGCLV